MSPADIWTKAIDMTRAQPAGPDALRELAAAFDRERDGKIVRAELAKAREREATDKVAKILARYEAATSSTRSRS